jgi:uncharacterized protein (UPF0147 family)
MIYQYYLIADMLSLPIRAANATSLLDTMSQVRRIESNTRRMLWQVVSNIEGSESVRDRH